MIFMVRAIFNSGSMDYEQLSKELSIYGFYLAVVYPARHPTALKGELLHFFAFNGMSDDPLAKYIVQRNFNSTHGVRQMTSYGALCRVGG